MPEIFVHLSTWTTATIDPSKITTVKINYNNYYDLTHVLKCIVGCCCIPTWRYCLIITEIDKPDQIFYYYNEHSDVPEYALKKIGVIVNKWKKDNPDIILKESDIIEAVEVNLKQLINN